MGSVNKVILVGNLGRDAELRYTPGGAPVATLNMATTEIWNDKGGQRQEKTEWHRVVLWGKTAESLSEYLTKGKQIYVEGRIQTLEALIKNATIIDENHSTDHVQIGSTVAVESPDGKEAFTIVGSAEAKPAEGRISNESPVGRALLGKKKGEKVVVKVPAGDFTYKIVGIT